MAKCGDCIHFHHCSHYVTAEETFPEVGGCSAFKNKGDFVEVVRCKDCKHALENPFITGCTKLVCSKWVNWRAVEPNHFCSYGERKDDGK